jgi:hypothetical protein
VRGGGVLQHGGEPGDANYAVFPLVRNACKPRAGIGAELGLQVLYGDDANRAIAGVKVTGAHACCFHPCSALTPGGCSLLVATMRHCTPPRGGRGRCHVQPFAS